MSEPTERNTPACPMCGSPQRVVPIVYGYPGPELIEAYERGEVALGGCTIGLLAPRWRCTECMEDF